MSDMASKRDREIDRYGVLREPAGKDLQALVELAAQIFDVPAAALNLITSDRQHQVATAGFDPSICAREDSMCAAVVAEPGPVVVSDASRDDRFERNPFVTGEIGAVRFYASAPLRTPEGVHLGRLCVFDERPRESSPEQHRALEVLAGRVMDVLELRLRSRQAHQSLLELTRTRDELRRSNEALAHFASQVSHDLRNPLMVVSANAELLASEAAVASDPELAAMAEEIRDASRRMARLIRSVLAQAQEGGRPGREETDLGAVFDRAALDLASQVQESGAEIAVHELPTVSGDAELLYAVAVNLLGNGLKFSRKGVSPRLEVRARRCGDAWRVLVSDEGVGVAPGQAQSVFLPYVRLDDGEAGHRVDGHGVGLATVRRIVEAHGGTVGLESRPQGGTTVWFELPADVGEAARTDL